MTVIVAVLCMIIILQRCGDNHNTPKNTTTVVRDTAWVIHDSTIVDKPQLIQTIVYRDTIPAKYVPSNNCDTLKAQFTNLRSDFLAKNIYKDTIKMDSSGSAYITDTTFENKLLGRKFSYKLKIPVVTTTITKTIYPTPKNQVYFVGSLIGNQSTIIDGINAGFLLKNKNDQIYLITGGLDTKGQINVQVGAAWKIHF